MYRRLSCFVCLVMGLLLLGTACNREQEGFGPGNKIVFRAATEYDNGPSTKTAYSGIVTGGKERIDWVTGDKIRIFSDVAACADGDHFCDYQVTGVTAGTAAGSDESSSYATIAQLRPNGLQWGSGDHCFYSIYPSTLQNSNIDFTSANVIAATLPSTQSYTVDGTTLKPSMDYAYMYAAVKTAAVSTVRLAYKPMFTAFQFTVDSRDDASITITSFTLSSESTAMAGDFTATLTAATASASSTVVYDFTDADAADTRSVTLSFGSGVTIVKGTPITFTVFALPRTYNDLTASFTTSAGETKSLALKEGSTGIPFTAGHKYDITSFGLPGEWTYTLSSLTGLTSSVHTGLMHELNASFQSYRQRGSVTEPLAYEFQYYDETDAEWKSGLPGWLTLMPEPTFAGSVSGEALEVAVAPQPIPALRDATIRPTEADKVGHESGDGDYLNLGRINTSLSDNTYGGWNQPYLDDDSKIRSANCYVVKAPGKYTFPLQIGNSRSNWSAHRSIKPNGRVRTSDETIPNEDGIFMGYYKDFEGNDIDQAVKRWLIFGDSRRTLVTNETMPVTVELIWTDSPRLVENVALHPTVTMRYITFEVPKEYITQGNALIALREAAGAKRIVWSWHIWVTDEDLSATVSSDTGYEFAPVDIGWCGGSRTYTARSCSLRVYQPVSGKYSDVVTISQPAGTTSPYQGNAPYYQDGRKDPLQASNGLTDEAKTYYYSDGYSYGSEGRQATSYAESIQNPTRFYPMVSGSNDWCAVHYRNLWDSTNRGYDAAYLDDDNTKTIYDPCPIGFKVPPPKAFNAFNATSFRDRTDAEMASEPGYGRIFTNSGGGTLFFPGIGNLHKDLGTHIWVQERGFYYTSFVTNIHSAVLTYFGPNDLNVNATGSRSFGRGIRPVREGSSSTADITNGQKTDGNYDGSDTDNFNYNWGDASF